MVTVAIVTHRRMERDRHHACLALEAGRARIELLEDRKKGASSIRITFVRSHDSTCNSA